MQLVSPNYSHVPLVSADNERIYPLDDRHKEEVLSFLGLRPLHTFIMSSWIRDNGLASSLNRGTSMATAHKSGLKVLL